ncbi:MAG: hypothetical protein Q9186_006199 [Xanthomendoza sp. 1 TL-2023]
MSFFSTLLILYPIVAAQSCSSQDNVLITFFGYPDNDPPGAGIAYPQCGRSLAGGTGTYDDPISFATAANGDFTPCDIVYLPWVKKYARFEDSCAKCGEDWDSSRRYHIDLWTGSTTVNGGDLQIDCENILPGGHKSIVRNPPNAFETDTTPFFANGNCNRKTFPLGSNLCAVRDGSSSPTEPNAAITTGANFPTTVASSRQQPTTLTATTRITQSSKQQCGWGGHCLGAPCRDENDCDGQLICTNSKCASL